jgi:hypothetical protein
LLTDRNFNTFIQHSSQPTMAYRHLACKHTENFDVTRLWGAGAWRQFQEEASTTAANSPVKAPIKLPLKVPMKIKTNPQRHVESQIEENIVVKTRSPVQQQNPLQQGSTTTTSVKTKS